MESLRNKAMLVKVVLGKQSHMIRDRALEQTLDSTHGTFNRAHVHKRLFKKSPRFKEVNSAFNRISQYYKENSLPWDEGVRVIPAENFFEFKTGLNEACAKAESKLEEFLNSYDDEVAKDIQEGGTMMSPQDYPTKHQVASHYYVASHFSPIPDADDFRIVEGISEEEREQLTNEALQAQQTKIDSVVKDCYNRLSEVVSHMVERVKEYTGKENERLHRSLVENISEQIRIVSKLNVTKSKELSSILDEIRATIGGVQIERLKALKNEREEVVSSMESIMEKMKAFTCGPKEGDADE